MPDDGRHIAVVGAGVFGGWTALHLLRAGARVTLLDAWGAGHARASSGGESRVLRHGYGADRYYPRLAERARLQWIEHGERFGRTLYHETGLLWLVGDDDEFERASVEQLAALDLPHEVLEPGEIAKRWPQVALDGVRWALVEETAGFLLAQLACRTVREAFEAEGGEFRVAQVTGGGDRSGRGGSAKGKAGAEDLDPHDVQRKGLPLADGSRLRADAYVFACGPWLATLFGNLLASLVTTSRQEVFVFGVPPGDVDHSTPKLGVWADHGKRFWYGMPAGDGRGFKLADDTRGPEFDPTTGDREPTAEGIASAREYLARRFPRLAGAPLLEARVCQYANAVGDDFLVDRIAGSESVWVAGGGSGHAFKHGPALGELVAGCVLGTRDVEPRFALGPRLASGL